MEEDARTSARQRTNRAPSTPRQQIWTARADPILRPAPTGSAASRTEPYSGLYSTVPTYSVRSVTNLSVDRNVFHGMEMKAMALGRPLRGEKTSMSLDP